MQGQREHRKKITRMLKAGRPGMDFKDTEIGQVTMAITEILKKRKQMQLKTVAVSTVKTTQLYNDVTTGQEKELTLSLPSLNKIGT